MLFPLKIFLFVTTIGATVGLRCHHCGYYTRLPAQLAQLWHLQPVTSNCLTPEGSRYMRPCYPGWRCAEAATSWRNEKLYERWCAPSAGCIDKALLQKLITKFDRELKVESYRCCDENGCNNSPSTELIRND